MADTCTLCDLPTPEPPVTAEDVDGAFCCRGCLAVARTMDDAAAADAAAARERVRDADAVDAADPADGDGEVPERAEEAFLSVDGMHCATCEAFVEGRATRHGGVLDAAASYPSKTVRLTYDPEAVDRESLPGVVEGMGYEAAFADRADDAGSGSEEDHGRLLVGGFFAMMTMLWYALFLYPVYFGFPPEALFVDVTGPAGTYLLGNVLVMATVVLGYTGYPIFRGAYVSLRAGHPNMDLLVALAAGTAYLYSVVALALGGVEVYFDIAVAIVVVVTVGNYYEGRMTERAASKLTELTRQRADEARRRTPDGTETVPVSALSGGEELVVKPGERVPADGTVVEGTAAVDRSLVTGESRPVRHEPGDEVAGGALVTDGRLVVAADEGAASTLDRLARRLWVVRSDRPGVQGLADRIAAVFVPVVVVLAVAATAVHLWLGATPTAALLTGLAVLVVSCPCALGLATPLSVAGGIRDALAEGIVVTNGSVFESAPETDVVAFDKTGTLTTGEMTVRDVAVAEDAEPTPAALLERAAAVERFADHPVAGAIVDAAPTSGADRTVTGFERHPGRGASATVDGTDVVVGRPVLFESRGWSVPADLASRVDEERDAGTVPAVVGWDGRARGVVVAADEPREGWAEVVAALADSGRRVAVITGDGEGAAARFGDHEAVTDVFAGVPPEAKAEVVERLGREGTVAMVGDGSNDAPALAAADLGISLESGTKLAADAADAVITTEDLASVPRVFELTGATNRRIRENLAWAFCYNAVAVPLALAGAINPLLAAVAMAASSLLVVGNSSRRVLSPPDAGAGAATTDRPATATPADAAVGGSDAD